MPFQISKPRIGFITWQYPPKPPRGTGIYAKQLVSKLVSHGWHIHVFTPKIAGPEENVIDRRLRNSDMHYTVHRIPSYSHPNPKTQLEHAFPALTFGLNVLISLHALSPMDILYVHDWTGILTAIAYRRALRCNLVYAVHTYLPIQNETSSSPLLPNDFFKLTLKEFQLIVVPSRD
ncbi:MAG: glycosyltransferase, partial [Candidatus Ranarchaeia archaeon]